MRNGKLLKNSALVGLHLFAVGFVSWSFITETNLLDIRIEARKAQEKAIAAANPPSIFGCWHVKDVYQLIKCPDVRHLSDVKQAQELIPIINPENKR